MATIEAWMARIILQRSATGSIALDGWAVGGEEGR